MKTIACVIVLSLCVSCTQTEKKEETETVAEPAPQLVEKQDTNHVKIYVNNDGSILLNDQAIDLKTLDARLQALNAHKGTVFYSRDNKEQDPPNEAVQVMDLVTKYGLPVQFYTDKTFTKIVEF